MEGEQYTDLSIILSALLMKYTGLWTAKNAMEERGRKLRIAYSFFMLSVALYFAIRDVYFSWDNLGDLLYVTCNLLSVILVVFKVHVLVLYRDKLTRLIDIMQERYWSCKYYAREKEMLNECKNICMFFILLMTGFGGCTFATYVGSPMISNIRGNVSQRILPFNVWYDSVLVSPYFEMTFVCQTFILFHIGACTFCFDNMFSILSGHTATQFRILQYRLETMCEIDEETTQKSKELSPTNYTIEIYQKFRIYIQQHQALICYCVLLEEAFTLITFGQVMITSVLLCMYGYQMLLPDNTLGRRIAFICLTFGFIFMLFMITYNCNILMEQSDKVADAMYATMWTQVPMNKFGIMLRRDLKMVVVRSRRACCITANGFFPVSLETYTTILSTAASYFTLLKSSVEDFQ